MTLFLDCTAVELHNELASEFTRLVDGSSEDTSKTDPIVDQCMEFSDGESSVFLIHVLKHLPLIFSDRNTLFDIGNFMKVLAVAILQMKDQTKLIETYTTMILSSNLLTPSSQLKLLIQLFHLLTGSDVLRLSTLKTIVELASKHHLLESIQSLIQSFSSWMRSWDISLNQVREMYLTMIRLSNTPNLTLIFEYLKTHGGAMEMNDDFIQMVTQFCSIKIETADVIDYDFVDEPIFVQVAEECETLKPLLALIHILAHGTFEEYTTFMSQHAKTLENLGLNQEKVQSKMQFLTLLSLANETQSIAYPEVASALHVPESEVESWVVAHCQSPHIEVKLSQKSHTLVVQRYAPRHFQNWSIVSTKASSLRSSMENLLELLKSPTKQ